MKTQKSGAVPPPEAELEMTPLSEAEKDELRTFESRVRNSPRPPRVKTEPERAGKPLKLMDDELLRTAAAYHEAGHAVIADEVGWWVNHEGVEIDARQYCGLRCDIDQYTTDNIVCINLAGWAAEFKWHGRGRLRDENDLLDLLSIIRDCHEDEVAFHRDFIGDTFETLEQLISDGPDRSDAEVVTLYLQYQAEVVRWLNHPKTWRAVEALAAALVRQGKLSEEQVDAVLAAVDDEFSANR